MKKPVWYPFDDGKTIGQHGSEEGVIVRDEEHGDGARITLERGCDIAIAPYSITCGIYGWAFHTRFFSTEPEAQREFEAMKDDIATILAMIPLKTDPEVDAKSSAVMKAISNFVEKFP